VGGFVNDIGFYPVKSSLMILKDMQLIYKLILLVNLVFNIILLVFVGISILLIYSLLMVGVETKSFETGIIRIMGVSKNSLASMIAV